MAKPVLLIMGYPAAGKSSIAQLKEVHENRVILSRDKMGGSVADLLAPFVAEMKKGSRILLDNTFPTAESRKPFLDAAKQHGHIVECFWLKTSIEDAQFNACMRMIRKHGKLLTPEEIRQAKDPNTYPPAPLFKYRKEFEPPRLDEGFESITEFAFGRTWEPKYKHGAIIFDYDDTLRTCKGSSKWPVCTDDVVLLPDRKVMIGNLSARLLGVSNQSAIAKGLSVADAVACFEHTNKLLGVDIDYEFCPHKVPPITCWCRKPMPGLGVHFIEKYKLDPAKVTMVGDMTSDKTFASRCGFQYVDAEDFFA